VAHDRQAAGEILLDHGQLHDRSPWVPTTGTFGVRGADQPTARGDSLVGLYLPIFENVIIIISAWTRWRVVLAHAHFLCG